MWRLPNRLSVQDYRLPHAGSAALLLLPGCASSGSALLLLFGFALCSFTLLRSTLFLLLLLIFVRVVDIGQGES